MTLTLFRSVTQRHALPHLGRARIPGSVEYTAYIGDDDDVFLRAMLKNEPPAPLGDQAFLIKPGQSFEGRTFEEWRGYLKARGGVARIIIDESGNVIDVSK